MKYEDVKNLKNHADTNYSRLYPILKYKIDKLNLSEEELPFPYEFICFEEDYFDYFIFMHEKNMMPKQIIDIGCQAGFQSEIFKDDMEYIGIDVYEENRLNTEDENVEYLIEAFPNLSIDLAGKCVISNMSLGYFNNYDEGLNDDVIVEGLSKCSQLYIGTKKEIVKGLEEYYDNVHYFNYGDFFRCVFWN